MTRPLRALVIGGTGFLGLNLVAALQLAGHDVVATRRRSSNTLFARRLRVPLVDADLDAPASLTDALRGRDVVFFAAGHYPRYSVDTDAQVALAVRRLRTALDASHAAGVRRFVFTSSVATVARPPDDRPARESDGLAAAPPGSTYFAVKLALERAALAPPPGLEVVVTCPTGCLGPYDHKVGTGFFLLGLLSRRLDVFLDGRINLVDARDVALAHLAAATRGAPGERYILGGHDLTVADFLARVSRRFDVPLPPRALTADQALAFATAEEQRCLTTGRGRPALSREMVDVITHGQFVAIDKARAALGLHPRPLGETLDATAAWYRHNGFIPSTGASPA